MGFQTQTDLERNCISVSYTHLDVYKRQTAFLSLIYFEILGLTMEDGEPVFHPQLPINCGHMLSLIHI